MSTLFNEQEADAVVNRVIARHNKLTNKRSGMDLIKRDDGTIVQVIEASEVNREEIVQTLEKAKAHLSAVENDLKCFDELNGQIEASANDTPQPEQPVQDQPVDAPVEQPAEEEAKPAPSVTTDDVVPIVMQ